MKVSKFPLTKIALSFILGILIAYNCKISLSISIIVMAFQVILLFVFYYFSKNQKKINLVFSIHTYAMSFVLGIITLLFHTESSQKSHYTHHPKAFLKRRHLDPFAEREKQRRRDDVHRDADRGTLRIVVALNVISDEPVGCIAQQDDEQNDEQHAA